MCIEDIEKPSITLTKEKTPVCSVTIDCVSGGRYENLPGPSRAITRRLRPPPPPPPFWGTPKLHKEGKNVARICHVLVVNSYLFIHKPSFKQLIVFWGWWVGNCLCRVMYEEELAGSLVSPPVHMHSRGRACWEKSLFSFCPILWKMSSDYTEIQCKTVLCVPIKRVDYITCVHAPGSLFVIYSQAM